MLTAGATTPVVMIVGSTLSGAAMGAAIAGGKYICTTKHFRLDEWSRAFAIGGATGAVAGCVGAGAAWVQLHGGAMLAEVIKAGAISGAAGSAASKIVGNILVGQSWYDGLFDAVLAGAIGGAIGAGVSNMMKDDVRDLLFLLKGGAAASLISGVGAVIHQVCKGVDEISWCEVVEAALIGFVMSVISGIATAKALRDRMVEDLLNHPGSTEQQMVEIARHKDVRLELIDKVINAVVDFFNLNFVFMSRQLAR